MTRVLLRSPRDPFAVVGPAEALDRNLVGGNSGNLVFLDAAHKLLSVPGREVRTDGFATGRREADRINDEFDVYVIPLANAFRLSFARDLDRLTRLVERLRIPVVVLGVGAQTGLDGDLARLAPIERSVRAFVAAVLDHGPSIGVRGEVSFDYLRSLGFRDVEAIGCPSMFLWGDSLQVVRRRPELTADARVAITVSPYVRTMGPVVRRHLEAYPNLTYIAQDVRSLELLVMGGATAGATEDDLPIHPWHPLFRDDKARFFLNPWPWLSELRSQDFAFGTRIHGTIAALLAGTPGYVLAHDSRTLELARHFGIPHRLMTGVGPELDAAELYAEADYTSLVDGHAARFATFAAFLARHGLDHVFAHEGAAAAWDARMARTPFAGAIRRSAPSGGITEPRARWHRLAYRARAAGRRLGLRTITRALDPR